MNYKQWNLLPIAEGSGISVDYVDPQGHAYSAPFCFSTLDEAINYGKLCIDQLIRSKSLINSVQ